jgi:hypothetical protein
MARNLEPLFEHYRQNLVALLQVEPRLKVTPQRDDIYVCPMCCSRYFTLDDLSNGSLTAEHAPPAKAGGSVNTLTCWECNNNQGSTLDSHLIRQLEILDALEGYGSTYVDGILSSDGEAEMRVAFRQPQKNHFELVGIPKASNPQNWEKIKQNFIDKGAKFNLRLNLGRERRAQLSLLRAAYLIAFQNLGYGFAFLNTNSLVLRAQFQRPSEVLYPIESVSYPIDLPDTFLGINVITAPIELQSYFIVFDVRIKDGKSRRVGVMLPGMGQKGRNMLIHLGDVSDRTMTVLHYEIGYGAKLRSPFIAYDIWNSIAGPN